MTAADTELLLNLCAQRVAKRYTASLVRAIQRAGFERLTPEERAALRQYRQHRAGSATTGIRPEAS